MLHTQLPQALYSVEQTRAIERVSCELLACDEFELMRRAGSEALSLIKQRWPQADRLLVVCGKGNNAGDGLVLAALAAQAHMQVDIYLLEGAENLSAVATQAYAILCQCLNTYPLLKKVEQQELCRVIESADVIVDALLGIGLQGAPRDAYAQLIQRLNCAQKHVLALDVPSGLCADTGQAQGELIEATATLSFVCLKTGLLMQQGLSACGDLALADLNIPTGAFDDVEPKALINTYTAADLSPRLACAHKNHFGHVLVVGGGKGMGGAAILCAQAAMRSGAGLVSLATLPEHVGPMLARCPDVMTHAVTSGQELEPLLARADVIVVGPGIGKDAWAQQMFMTCMRSDKPLVIDAGALDLLAAECARSSTAKTPHNNKNHASKLCAQNLQRLHNCVLTPHPGEALRMLAALTFEPGEYADKPPAPLPHNFVQAQRLASVRKLQAHYPGTVVLKGAGTLLADNNQILLSGRASPALATAGSGDVLAGILGALLAQGCNKDLESLTPLQLAAVAVNTHLAAADVCNKSSATRSVLASDLLEVLPQVFN